MADKKAPNDLPLPEDNNPPPRLPSDVSMMDTTEPSNQPRQLTFTASQASGSLPWIAMARNVVNEEALRTAAAAAAAASADDEEYHRSDPAARLQLDSGRLPLFFGSDKDTLTPDLWIERVERTATLHVWSERLTLDTAVNALRDQAAEWYNGAKNLNTIDNWFKFRFNFLACLGKTHVATVDSFTYLLNSLKPKQKGESLISLYNRVSSNITKYLEAMGSDLPPRDARSLHGTAIMSLPGAALLPPAEWSRCCHIQRVKSHTAFKAHLAKSVFFAALPANIKVALKNKSSDQWDTVDQCLRLALDLELTLNESSTDSSVSAVQVKRQRTGPHQKGQSRTMANGQPMICHYCKKKGHGQKECRKRAAENGAMKPMNQKPPANNTPAASSITVASNSVNKYPTYQSLN